MGHSREREIACVMRALAAAWGAPRIAVWELQNNTPTLLCIGHMVQSDLEQARQVWAQSAASLSCGRSLRVGEHLFHPLRDGEQRLVGFVHLADCAPPRTRGQETLCEQVLFQLTLAVATPLEGATRPSKGARDAAWHKRRAELIVELDQNDWNFARLGRRKGVTRQTIHNWVSALDVERPLWARRARDD